MTLDPDHSPWPPPPPPHRDWFFPPAPPFLPSSSSSRPLAPRTPFPSTSRSYKPYSPADRRPLAAPRPRSRSPHPSPDQQSPQPPSAPRLRGWDPRYAGVRRGDAPAASAPAPPAAAAPRAAPGKKPALAPRWSGMLSAAALLLCFASLLHRNFLLHDQQCHTHDAVRTTPCTTSYIKPSMHTIQRISPAGLPIITSIVYIADDHQHSQIH